MTLKTRSIPKRPGQQSGLFAVQPEHFLCWAFEAYKIKRE